MKAMQIFIVSLMIPIVFPSCSKNPDSLDVTFTGTWKITADINNENYKSFNVGTNHVKSKNKMFRILEENGERETLFVYDGNELHFRNKNLTLASDLPPSGTSSTPSSDELRIRRFWTFNPPEGVVSVQGELIAGRETDFYQFSFGAEKNDLWLDRVSRVVLKHVLKDDKGRNILTECQSISYGSVDDTEFKRPW